MPEQEPSQKPMRYFLDTEFNGFGGELISIAAVAEEDETIFFYEAIPCKQPTDWVAKHVLPVLQTTPLSREEVARRFAGFLINDPQPRLVADWPEDIAHVPALLTDGNGKRLIEQKMEFELLAGGDFASEKLSECPHNAYHDALALRQWAMARKSD